MKLKLSKISALFLSSFFAITTFASCQNNDEWWNHTDSLTVNDIGTIREVLINDISYQVRLIGIDQDIYVNNLTAHTTWEFVNVIHDSYQYAKSLWDDVTTYRFDESALNVMLNWELYKSFPEGLQKVMKFTNKKNLHYYYFSPMHWYAEATDYYTWLFPLSISEMIDDSSYVDEGETYLYYKKGNPITKTKINSVSPVDYWTRSPDPSDDDDIKHAYCITSTGSVQSRNVEDLESNSDEHFLYYSVAFCI